MKPWLLSRKSLLGPEEGNQHEDKEDGMQNNIDPDDFPEPHNATCLDAPALWRF